jgi:protease-4
VDDICASGGYYIAAAADRIFVDKASLVGSIGVLMDGFGFTEGMKKLGVERRLLTAGENKGFLDPFSPVDPTQETHARAMLGEVHDQFIHVVRQGRGKRLKETPDMFSGLVWSGARSIELGLADALGSLDYVAREVVKAEEIVDFTPQEGLAERLARRIGTAMGQAMGPWAKENLRVR